MSKLLKDKPWINDITRINNIGLNRENKLRLDQNERTKKLPQDFINQFGKEELFDKAIFYPDTVGLIKELSVIEGVTTDMIAITAGADMAIRYSFEIFTQSKSKIIHASPTYRMTEINSEIFNCRAKKIFYSNTLELPIADWYDAIDNDTKLIVISNPDNPTGTSFQKDALLEIIYRAHKFDCPILIDEAYFGFGCYTLKNYISEYNNLIICRSFSKAAGIPGCRIGYVMANPNLIKLYKNIRPLHEVDGLGCEIAKKICTNQYIMQDWCNMVIKNKQKFLLELNNKNFTTLDTLANFVYTDFNSNNILNRLQDNNILVSHGRLNIKGYENFTRITIGDDDVMQNLSNLIYKYCKG